VTPQPSLASWPVQAWGGGEGWVRDSATKTTRTAKGGRVPFVERGHRAAAGVR